MKNLLIKQCFIFLFCILSAGCVSVKKEASGVISSYMENGCMKYYIRPEKMQGTQKDEFVLIDFSYQKKNDKYVSASYVNFTLYCKTVSYIKSAIFISEGGKETKRFMLSDIHTLDRNADAAFIRVTTLLGQSEVGAVLEGLHGGTCELEVVLESGETKRFTATAALRREIEEAFRR